MGSMGGVGIGVAADASGNVILAANSSTVFMDLGTGFLLGSTGPDSVDAVATRTFPEGSNVGPGKAPPTLGSCAWRRRSPESCMGR